MTNYTIIFADGNNVVVNGTPSPTTDSTRVITFWGQGTTSWGAILMQNFAKLLEHASGSTDPHNGTTKIAARGQIWHEFHGANQHYLKLRGDGTWHNILVLSSSTTSPTSPFGGQMWYDTSVNKLKTYINGSWVILGDGVSRLGDTMTGFLTLNANPTSSLHAATKQYVDTQVSTLTGTITTDYVPKTGTTLTGFLTLNANPTSSLHAATKQYVDTQITTQPVLKSGSTMTGPLILNTHPTVGSPALQAATKQYVDTAVSAGPGLGYTPVNKAGDTMTGFLTLHANPSLGMHTANKLYVDGFLNKTSGGVVTGTVDFQNTVTFTNNVVCGAVPSANNHLINKLFLDTNFLPKVGGSVTGNITSSATPSLTNHLITKGYADSNYLNLAGGTLSGNLTVTGVVSQSTSPTNASHLANKQYVDTTAVLLSGSATITGVKTFSTLPKSPNAPVAADDVVNKQYVDNAISTGGGSFVPMSGGTYTGLVSSSFAFATLPSDPSNNSLVTFKVVNDRFMRKSNTSIQQTSTTNYDVIRYTSVDSDPSHYALGDIMPKQAVQGLMNGYLEVDGSTAMTGALVLSGAPTLPLHAATKQYVDSVGGQQTPSGSISYFIGSTVPSGWLECNGAAVSRTTYAAIFAIVGITYGTGDGVSTFNLPDFRGEFIRAWDHGRGVDTGRTLGSFQTDSIKDHTHFRNITGDQEQTLNASVGGTKGNANGGSSSDLLVTHTGGVVAVGSTETRPRNVALMVMIKV